MSNEPTVIDQREAVRVLWEAFGEIQLMRCFPLWRAKIEAQDE